LSLEVYQVAHEPEPSVRIDVITPGAGRVYTHLMNTCMEIVVVMCKPDDSGGLIFAHDAGTISRARLDLKAATRDENLAGQAFNEVEYLHNFCSEEGSSLMRVIHLKTANNKEQGKTA
jgi:hypothetical protein